MAPCTSDSILKAWASADREKMGHKALFFGIPRVATGWITILDVSNDMRYAIRSRTVEDEELSGSSELSGQQPLAQSCFAGSHRRAIF